MKERWQPRHAAPPPDTLTRRSLPLDAIELAQALIGKTLIRIRGRRWLGGRIVETEAYLPDDPASHSFRGPTNRNRAMFLRRGHAYVYRIYGMWLCLNVSADTEGTGAAVLLRAIEPIAEIEAMRAARGGVPQLDVARGPGKLCVALGIDVGHNGMDLCDAANPLRLGAAMGRKGAVGFSARIGLTRAVEDELRFYERGNPYVSGPPRMRV